MRGADLTRFENGAAVLAAVLLLILQVAIPPGFMLASGAGSPTGGLAMVICTGRGPVQLHPDAPGKAPHSHAGTICAFAGHAGASLVPDLAAPRRVAFFAPAALVLRAVRLAPGRGLAAPPPPSTGPPSVLI
ncbi:MAG TPA: hypothetical protein VE309_06565 [Caulobacteraceae bacterium]|nr:hypothetical protein [Caulobacteraceae bacterium]